MMSDRYELFHHRVLKAIEKFRELGQEPGVVVIERRKYEELLEDCDFFPDGVSPNTIFGLPIRIKEVLPDEIEFYIMGRQTMKPVELEWINELLGVKQGVRAAIGDLSGYIGKQAHGGIDNKPKEKIMEDVEILSRRLSRLSIEMKQELVRETLSRKTEMWPGAKTMKIEGIKPLGEEDYHGPTVR